MIERFGKLPDDVDQLKALALGAMARADRSEAQASANEKDAEVFRSQTLSLTAKVEDLTQTNAAAKAEIDRLTSIIKTLRRDRFGKRSEKLGADEAEQQSFVFEEIETGLAAIATRLAAKAEPKPRKASTDKPRFPSHLERVEVILEPEVPPEFEGKERVRIGQEESVRLDVVRARFRLIVTIRPKYAYKEPAAILQAPAPEHIVEAGLPTEALLAQVAVSKYADGLPLYRQEAIYGRDGVELSRSLMAQWMGSVGFHFEPLAAHVLVRIREGERIFADETTLPTLNPAPERPRRRGCGPMRGMIGRSAARGRRWWPIVMKTVDPATARCVTWAIIAASCNATVTRDIESLRALRMPTACVWPDVGHTCAAGSSTCMPTANPLSRRRPSNR